MCILNMWNLKLCYICQYTGTEKIKLFNLWLCNGKTAQLLYILYKWVILNAILFSELFVYEQVLLRILHSVSLCWHAFVVLIIWSKWAFSVVGTWSWETSSLSVNVGHSVKRSASTSWRSPREVPITRRDSKNSNVPIKKIMKKIRYLKGFLFTVNRYRHCLSFCLTMRDPYINWL